MASRVGWIAALSVALLALAGCTSGSSLTLEQMGYDFSDDYKRGATTYNCNTVCHHVTIKVTNKSDKILDLDDRNWEVHWPAGQLSGIIDLETPSQRIDAGGSFNVKAVFGTPEGVTVKAKEIWLYDAKYGEPTSHVLAKMTTQ